MRSKVSVLVASTLVVWGTALTIAVGHPVSAGNSIVVQTKKTTNDGLYTKAQADGAREQFEKICADCHPFTVAAKKKPKDKPLGEDPFFENWTGRPLSELVTLIHLQMPDDGSADVSEEEAIDLVAYILQQNGFTPGQGPLSKESLSATIERPVKK